MLNGRNDSLLSQYYRTGPEIGLYDNHLTIRSIKLYADGALGSRGAWLIEDYEDARDIFIYFIFLISNYFRYFNIFRIMSKYLVDYVFKKNDDGSVSCFVGNIDLPSRTQWRVEIKVDEGKASFITGITISTLSC